jgi:hypothetical protein
VLTYLFPPFEENEDDDEMMDDWPELFVSFSLNLSCVGRTLLTNDIDESQVAYRRAATADSDPIVNKVEAMNARDCQRRFRGTWSSRGY